MMENRTAHVPANVQLLYIGERPLVLSGHVLAYGHVCNKSD